MPTMTIPSANMRRLRRELEASRRRAAAAALAPTGGVAKKQSSPPQPQISSPPPRCTAPTSPTAPAPSEAVDLIKNTFIGKGAQVRVRTPAGTLHTGQRLVLWLRAVVVSAADDDGYLRVTYNSGKFPRDDPFGAVRVARKDVKPHMPQTDAISNTAASSASSAVTTDSYARPPQHKTAAPRPTVAGKKLPLPKKLEKEMQSRSKAIIDCWYL